MIDIFDEFSKIQNSVYGIEISFECDAFNSRKLQEIHLMMTFCFNFSIIDSSVWEKNKQSIYSFWKFISDLILKQKHIFFTSNICLIPFLVLLNNFEPKYLGTCRVLGMCVFPCSSNSCCCFVLNSEFVKKIKFTCIGSL